VRYIGGSWGAGTGISLDAAGNIWVAGRANPRISSEAFPTVHPFQAKDGGGFVTEIANDGSSLLFSSLTESAQQIALDSSGNAFLVGSTYSNTAKTSYSALLQRIDASVPSALTLEEPMPIVTSPGSIDHGAAAGEIVVLAGSGLGPSQEAGAVLGPLGRLATTLGGTSVTFDGRPAPLLSVQAQKIVCIVPFGLRNTTTVQVQNNGTRSNSILVPVWSSAIEIVTVVNADGTINSSTHPAAPGSIVTFYGAGFGETSPSSAGADGAINGSVATKFVTGTVAANIASQNAQVLYAGPAPGQVTGVVQINVRVPQVNAGSYPALIGWSPLNTDAYTGVTLWVGTP
jgi:uncharacterized protein (TIGR03437 family)